MRCRQDRPRNPAPNIPMEVTAQMLETGKDSVFETILGLMNTLAEDWDYEGEITSSTWLVEDLGLESIDVVVLGTTIQNHYDRTLPFAEFMAEIGQREVRDIRLDELVEFVHRHLVTPDAP